jgi:hypothetical protein
MNNILNWESNPHLVVLNGDLISGEDVQLDNGTHYIDQLIQPIISRNVPFATSYGNHDHDYNLSTRQMLEREKLIAGALSKTSCYVQGDENVIGTSNYFLPVYSNGGDGPQGELRMLLWFFDSKGGKRFQQRDSNGERVDEPDWIDDTVSHSFLLMVRLRPGMLICS